jgi:ribosomal-protein-serine acetyltransferase
VSELPRTPSSRGAAIPGHAAPAGATGVRTEPATPLWRPAGRPDEVLRGGPAVLRRIRPADADELAAAVVASLDHLRPWMPWADSYAPADATAYTAAVATGWEEGTELAYRISSGPDGGLLGAISLMARIGPGELEIGYWLRADALGRGLATGAAAAVTVAALGLPDVGSVEIHHDVANRPSGAVPHRLGFTRRADLSRPAATPAETGTLACWSLTADQLADSAAQALVRDRHNHL